MCSATAICEILCYRERKGQLIMLCLGENPFDDKDKQQNFPKQIYYQRKRNLEWKRNYIQGG